MQVGRLGRLTSIILYAKLSIELSKPKSPPKAPGFASGQLMLRAWDRGFGELQGLTKPGVAYLNRPPPYKLPSASVQIWTQSLQVDAIDDRRAIAQLEQEIAQCRHDWDLCRTTFLEDRCEW